MDMMEVTTEQVLTAFAVTAAAGLATAIGGLLVLFTKGPSPRLLAFGLAFAGGAMVYVSLSEILNKSILSFSAAYDARTAFAFATLAFIAGVVATAVLDHAVENPHQSLDPQGGEYVAMPQHQVRRIGLMAAIAITVHNLPEGLATFFATLDNAHVGLGLAAAIAIHNIPEGISIAVPIYVATNNRLYALLACVGSGLAEPLGALIGYTVLAPYLSDAVFGAVFGAIAGIMVFLALDELLPAAKRYARGHETVYGLVLGMAVMAASLVLFKWYM